MMLFLHKIFSHTEQRNFTSLLICVISVLLFTSCAAISGNGKVLHGFVVANAGSSDITDVVIHYGSVTQTFCKPVCNHPRPPARIGVGGGGGWFAYMLVEEQMMVTWKTDDGLMHEAQVPVRSRIKDLKRLSTLYLQFERDHLQVQ